MRVVAGVLALLAAMVSAPARASDERAVLTVLSHIFLVPGLGFPGDVTASRVVLDTPHRLPDGTTLWPSDHYGVLAELVVSGIARDSR